MSFKALLKRLQKKHYPSVRAFADALKMDPTRISRAQPFDIRGCLRLAQVTGEDPSVVLRAAGKADVATLIERLYGPGKILLTAEQQDLLTALAGITDVKVRQSLIELARAAAGTTSKAGAGGGSTPGSFGGGTVPPNVLPTHKMSDLTVRRGGTHR